MYIFVSFSPPSDAAILVSSVFASSSLEAIFLMFCHLIPGAARFEDCQMFFFSFLCFVDTREAAEEVLFDQAPATPYLHAQVYRRLALAAIWVAVEEEEEEE